MSSEQVVKRRGNGPRGMLRWEAAGLAWLARAEGGARIVEVTSCTDDELREPRVESAGPTRAMAEEFGVALAATHRFGAAGFGAAPDGWQGDGFIGAAVLPMPDQPVEQAWGAFYADFRLLPFAQRAERQGSLPAGGMRTIERVCERLRSGDFDDGRPASRIHGDLWSGNVLWSPDGVVLIDPAAHGGHAETDIAMLHLFGLPQLDVVGAAWAEAYQPADGWRERIGLHQLHPLLVHAELFGGGYGAQAVDVAARYA